jgi:hypothetical protein
LQREEAKWGARTREQAQLEIQFQQHLANQHQVEERERRGFLGYYFSPDTQFNANFLLGSLGVAAAGGGAKGPGTMPRPVRPNVVNPYFEPSSGRFSGRYADGQKAYRTNVPRNKHGVPEPESKQFGPHTRLQRDKKDPRRIYSGTEFDINGNPVRRIDLTGRRGDEIPHQHRYDSKTKEFLEKESLD